MKSGPLGSASFRQSRSTRATYLDDSMEDADRRYEGIRQRCVRIIREYWVARGYNVAVGQKWAPTGDVIVSDLVDGLPRDWRK